MEAAFVDSSVVVALVMREAIPPALRRAFYSGAPLFASNLLEAEVASALSRERVGRTEAAPRLRALRWVLPSRPLTAEISRVAQVGPIRGADLWHLACALFLAAEPAQLPFLTLDKRQRELAARLGFPVPGGAGA